MNKFRNYTALGVLFVTLMSGCVDFGGDGRISEGVIEYKVSYPKLDPSSILAELLPTKMIMTFKDNEFMTDLSAGFGMFRMNVISTGDAENMAQMVKLINERFVVKYNPESVQKSNGNLTPIKIDKTENTKTIAGYLCKEAVVTVMNESKETYTIYYTNEIRIDQSNWFTNMAEIDGVLLEYQVERYNLCSRFTAVSVTAKEIDDEIFEVPEEYEEIQEEEMNQKMEEIFNNFSE